VVALCAKLQTSTCTGPCSRSTALFLAVLSLLPGPKHHLFPTHPSHMWMFNWQRRHQHAGFFCDPAQLYSLFVVRLLKLARKSHLIPYKSEFTSSKPLSEHQQVSYWPAQSYIYLFLFCTYTLSRRYVVAIRWRWRNQFWREFYLKAETWRCPFLSNMR
jgi:hypothetical protein